MTEISLIVTLNNNSTQLNSFYCCIEVNDKHWVCPSSVMAQNTEYIGLNGIKKQKRSTEGCSKFKSPETRQLRCDVTPTLRIVRGLPWIISRVRTCKFMFMARNPVSTSNYLQANRTAWYRHINEIYEKTDLKELDLKFRRPWRNVAINQSIKHSRRGSRFLG